MSSALRRGEAILGTGLQKNAALFRTVWGRGSQAAGDRGQTPFLDICLNEDETRLTKVDMNCRGPVGSDGREEILRLQAMNHLLKLLAVSCEEDDTCSRSVANANDIASDNLRAIRGSTEWLIVVS